MLDNKHQIAWHGWAPGFRPRYWGGYHSDNADKKKTTNFSNIKDKELDELIIKFRNGKESEQRIKLSHKIEERIFDLAPAIPTFKTPFFRYAYWRWIKLPEFHSTKSNDYLDDYGLFWIDQDLEKEIRSKMLKEEIIYGTEKLIINDTYKPGKVK